MKFLVEMPPTGEREFHSKDAVSKAFDDFLREAGPFFALYSAEGECLIERNGEDFLLSAWGQGDASRWFTCRYPRKGAISSENDCFIDAASLKRVFKGFLMNLRRPERDGLEWVSTESLYD